MAQHTSHLITYSDYLHYFSSCYHQRDDGNCSLQEEVEAEGEIKQSWKLVRSAHSSTANPHPHTDLLSTSLLTHYLQNCLKFHTVLWIWWSQDDFHPFYRTVQGQLLSYRPNGAFTSRRWSVRVLSHLQAAP